MCCVPVAGILEITCGCNWNRRVRVDQEPSSCSVRLGQKLIDRHFYKVRIADIAVAIGDREPHNLAYQVEVSRGVMDERLEIVALKHVQLFKHGDAATAGWLRKERISPIGCADWNYPFGLVVRKILRGQNPAVRLHELYNCGSHRPVVEPSGTVRRNVPQGPSKIRLSENFSRPRQASI